MPFTLSQLASFSVKLPNGDQSLSVRRPIPVPRYSLDLSQYYLPRPQRLWEISVSLYKDPGYWAFLAEWNGLPNPTRYLLEYLPSKYRMYYLPEDLLEDYYFHRRIVTVNGAGDLT